MTKCLLTPVFITPGMFYIKIILHKTQKYMASVLSLLALVTFIPKLLPAFINDKHFWQSNTNTRGENSCHGNTKQLQQPNIQGIAWCCYYYFNEFKMSYKLFPKSARKVLLFVPIDSVKAAITPLLSRERAMDCNCGLGKGT